MTRPQRLDLALLAVFVPLWALCFGLHLRELARGTLAWVPVTVAAPPTPEGHPTVSGFWPDAGAAVEELRVGDRLLRVGERVLAGRGPFGFVAEVYPAADETLRVPVRLEREGVRREAAFALRPVGMSWRLPLLSLGFAVPGFLVLWRRSGSRAGRAFFAATLCYALHWTFFFGGPPGQTWLWFAFFASTAFLIFPLALRAVLAFPEGGPPAGRGTRAWTWLFAAYGLGALGWVFGVPVSAEAGVRVAGALNALAPLVMIVLLTQRFVHAEPLGRRQLKWIVYGFWVGVLPVAVGSLVPAVTPGRWWIHEILMSAVVALPICFLIAIARYNLFDVDRLISATASYNVLGVLLVGGGLVAVPRAAEAASEMLGVDRTTGQVALSLALAAVAVPAHRRLRPRLERVFFAERHALEQRIGELLREVSSSPSPQALLARVAERLDALLRPEGCALYVREAETLRPVFARGRALPPALPARSSLAALLAERRGPLASEDWPRGRRAQALSDFDRATLDALGVPLLVPIWRGDELFALLCLGPKRSGDVYTATDRTLLAAVADKVSGQLERFDQAEVLRQAQAMQESLRRYVPGAVADTLAAGDDLDLEAGERDVTVLFVDIRGYTSFAESRRAQEIFSTVNRYTETVSHLVREHGGSVVEFNGDGLMAVFGAPRALGAKERAAVEAGRAIVAAVADLDAEGGAAAPLAVGVGIATGPGFVGNIRAVDRLIWSVIGNTTILAARLQGLTRQLDAAMVIDPATWERCGAVAAEFDCRSDVAIRGRRESHDVYVLPLEAHPPGPADAAGADWTGLVLAGRYRIDAVLGSGGMAAVYRATDRRLERPVVIKVPHEELLLRPGFRERFAAEVRNLTRLEHPHVVKIHDVGEEQGVPYAVVQHLGGGDLRQRLEAAGGRISPTQLVEWLAQVASALDHLHATGFVHRDVKPDNVLFDDDGHAYLSDLGIATALGESEPWPRAEPKATEAETDLTRPGLLLGAANYTPPEALDREFAPAYDQYGLGVVVYEALSGRLPFEELAPGELLLAKVSDEPTPLVDRAEELPEPLCTAVMRTLQRDPDARFPSCGSFADAFRASLGSSGT